MIQNIIIIAILLAMLGLAVFAIVHSKKSGKKCIGCPDSGCCSKGKSGECCCGTQE